MWIGHLIRLLPGGVANMIYLEEEQSKTWWFCISFFFKPGNALGSTKMGYRVSGSIGVLGFPVGHDL